jgi:hypothetical protein
VSILSPLQELPLKIGRNIVFAASYSGEITHKEK